MRLLVTRPAPDGERTAAVLRARGHEVVLAPLTTVEALPASLAGRWRAVLITSANAIRALSGRNEAESLKPLPVFAVGSRSADAARDAGFRDVTAGEGDVDALCALAATRLGGNGDPLLYLAGADRAGDLGGDLGRHGIAVVTAVVYRATARDGFDATTIAALDAARIDGVLHYSRRSAALYIDAATSAGILDKALIPKQYCLSPQIAARLRQSGAAAVQTAVRPEEAALIELIGFA